MSQDFQKSYQKSGYLTDAYRFFHLKDTSLRSFDFHYHDFHKILLFLSGNTSYIVEGRLYELQPGDVLLIPAGEIHKPQNHGGAVYERMILYISEEFLQQNSTPDTDLAYCFRQAAASACNLLRTGAEERYALLGSVADQLPEVFSSDEYGSDLYRSLKVQELLLVLGRLLSTSGDLSISTTTHPTVLAIMNYINDHITEDLSIERIAGHMFLNRSYAMHLFKAETGYTIGKYITKKRLFLAGQYRKQGLSVTESCFLSGFKNYSAFYHAEKGQRDSGFSNE